MDDANDHSLHTRLDRLAELIDRRFQRIEDRLRGLDEENGAIIGLLVALKAGLEDATAEAGAEAPEPEEPDPAAGMPLRLN